jgi:hypothetical protein
MSNRLCKSLPTDTEESPRTTPLRVTWRDLANSLPSDPSDTTTNHPIDIKEVRRGGLLVGWQSNSNSSLYDSSNDSRDRNDEGAGEGSEEDVVKKKDKSVTDEEDDVKKKDKEGATDDDDEEEDDEEVDAAWAEILEELQNLRNSQSSSAVSPKQILEVLQNLRNSQGSSSSVDASAADFCPAQIKRESAAADFRPAQIKRESPTNDNNLGNTFSRRMRQIMSKRLWKSLPTEATPTTPPPRVTWRDLASSLPADLSDTIPITDKDLRGGLVTNNMEEETNREETMVPIAAKDRRGRFCSNREESTRTFDSWAQTVNSSDEKGGSFLDWEKSKKKMSSDSLSSFISSSNSLDAVNSLDADGGEGGAKEDDVKEKSQSSFPIEISEMLEDMQYRRSRRSTYESNANNSVNSAGSFIPAQIKPANFGNRLSRRMKHMSSKLSSSLASASTRTTWNLTNSTSSDHWDHHRSSSQGWSLPSSGRRGSLSWSLASSDVDGAATDRSTRSAAADNTASSNQDEKLSFLRRVRSSGRLKDGDAASTKTNDSKTTAYVAALSSSFTGGDAKCRPIRICREDNVDIEELRREIISSGNSNNEGKPRRKKSFTLFSSFESDDDIL